MLRSADPHERVSSGLQREDHAFALYIGGEQNDPMHHSLTISVNVTCSVRREGPKGKSEENGTEEYPNPQNIGTVLNFSLLSLMDLNSFVGRASTREGTRLLKP